MEAEINADDQEFETEMLPMLALELALDEGIVRAKKARLLDLTNGCGERIFAAIHASNNERLFRDHFRMNKHAFDALFELCTEFIPCSLRDRREALGVLMDWLGNASTCRKQEVFFNFSFSTVHKYRMIGLQAVVLALQSLMRMPSKVPNSFKHKYPYFDQAICAIDGAHFPLTVARADSERFRNRKGWISTNVLVATDWTMRICYAYVGAEGSAHDASVLHWSQLLSQIPGNFYAIADAGYGLSDKVLTPFRSVRYHLKEWAVSENGRPQNAEELFNLRHAKARNIVERVIGVLKRRFCVLRTAMECEFSTCKTATFASMLLHNFIRDADSSDRAQDFDDLDMEKVGGVVQNTSNIGRERHHDSDELAPTEFDFSSGTAWRRWMADTMWDEYQQWRIPEHPYASSDSDDSISSSGDDDTDEDMREAIG